MGINVLLIAVNLAVALASGSLAVEATALGAAVSAQPELNEEENAR